MAEIGSQVSLFRRNHCAAEGWHARVAQQLPWVFLPRRVSSVQLIVITIIPRHPKHLANRRA
jgi:hypothetical protein